MDSEKNTRKRIHLCLPHLSGREKDFIDEALAGSWVVPLGPHVDGFEEDLKHFLTGSSPELGGLEIAAVASGTAALHLALIMLGVTKGDYVICQSFTFAASANPVVYQGATPVFIDSEPDTWNMDPELLEKAISELDAQGKRPKAIIPVHLYGMPAKIDKICEIASRWEIPVVEDAAEALGSTFKGRHCGTFGRFGVLSFNGNKMITASGGGAVVCPDEASKKRCIFFATQAREAAPHYQHEHIGYNYRLSNVSAAVGRGQMCILQEHIDRHRHLAALYTELFKDTEGIEVHLNPSADFESNYWLSTIIAQPALTGLTPEKMRSHLASLNIESRPLWKPMHLQPVYADAPAYINGVSEKLFDSGLCLPSGPCVSDDDARMIAAEIKSLIRR